MLSVLSRRLRLHLRRFWDFIGTALLDQTLVSGVGFFMGFFLTKHLGLDLFGRFSLLLLIAYLCLEIQRSLVIAPMMTLLARSEDNTAYLAQLGYLQMGLNLVLSLAAWGFVLLSGTLFPKWGIAPLASVGFFLVFARLQQEFLRRVFFVQGFARRALALDMITVGMTLLSLYLLTRFGRLTLETIIWWQIAAYLCPSFLFMRHVVHLRLDTGTWPQIVRDHLNFGSWLVGSSVVQFLSGNALLMIGGAIMGATTVGLFKSAQYLTGGVNLLFQALENVVPLRLARLYRQPDAGMRVRYIKAIALFLFLFIAGYVLLMTHLIPFFARYMRIMDVTLFSRLALALLLQSFLLAPVLLLGYILRAQYRTRPVFYTNIATATISLSSASFLVVTWHAMGIVYGMILLQTMIVLSLAAFAWRGRHHAVA